MRVRGDEKFKSKLANKHKTDRKWRQQWITVTFFFQRGVGRSDDKKSGCGLEKKLN